MVRFSKYYSTDYYTVTMLLQYYRHIITFISNKNANNNITMNIKAALLETQVPLTKAF